jgi:hypothetical protein
MYIAISETLFQASRNLQVHLEINDELPVVVRKRLDIVVDEMDEIRHELDTLEG